jgi:hypothetical protein
MVSRRNDRGLSCGSRRRYNLTELNRNDKIAPVKKVYSEPPKENPCSVSGETRIREKAEKGKPRL